MQIIIWRIFKHGFSDDLLYENNEQFSKIYKWTSLLQVLFIFTESCDECWQQCKCFSVRSTGMFAGHYLSGSGI